MATNSTLLLSRIAAVVIVGPSLLANLKTLFTIYIGYCGSPLQNASRISTLISIGTDIVILVANAAVNVVYITALRFRAVNRGRASIIFRRPWPILFYMAVDTILSTTAVVCQLHAYISTKWLASLARASDTFQAYRITTFTLSFMYIFLGVAADMQLVLFARTSSIHEAAFKQIRVFHNHLQYLYYEVITFVGFALSVVWGALDPLNVTVFIYIEQLVLSYMMLNGISLIQVGSKDGQEMRANFLSTDEGGRVNARLASWQRQQAASGLDVNEET
ncbi:hypothetical protein DFJ73DRAFT_794652 [Zopfochytrium polystomum]|nr:hypothetical protein DFJ73DRAFT_794652 [Zopfochytrium polystomum]